MKKAAIIALTISLVGCATPQYYQPAVSYSAEDQAFCRYEALKATASSPSGSVAYPYVANTLAQDIQTGIRQGEMMALCLQMRKQSANR